MAVSRYSRYSRIEVEANLSKTHAFLKLYELSKQVSDKMHLEQHQKRTCRTCWREAKKKNLALKAFCALQSIAKTHVDT